MKCYNSHFKKSSCRVKKSIFLSCVKRNLFSSALGKVYLQTSGENKFSLKHNNFDNNSKLCFAKAES